MQPDATVPDIDHYTDVAVDATYQYTPEGPGAILVNASLIHEKQQLNVIPGRGRELPAPPSCRTCELPHVRRRRLRRYFGFLLCPGSARCRFEALSSPP